MNAAQSQPASLYRLLGEPAAGSTVRGETTITKAKETLHNDLEMLVLEEVMEHV